MIYATSVFLACALVLISCSQAADETSSSPPVAGRGLVVSNSTAREIAVLGVAFDGKRELPAVALGAGVTKTLMGKIVSVRGLPTVNYTYGRVGDASVQVEMQKVNYEGVLDRLVLRLGADDRWILIGESGGTEVFRSAETSRREIPANKE